MGTLCSGISSGLGRAADVMDAFKLKFAELPFVVERDVGDHSSSEVAAIDVLL